MRRYFRPLALATALLCPSLPLQAQPTPELTLAQALARAEAGNPLLAAARLELDAHEGTQRQAAARPNPELSAEVEGLNRSTRTTTATLSIPLELGGKRAARMAAAERGREVARAELNGTRAAVRSAAIAAFFDLLIAQERLQLATGAKEIAARAADSAARRVQAGRISPVDATRAQVAQANAALELAQAQTALQSARRQLAAQWGAELPDFGPVSGALDSLPQRPAAEALQQRLADAPALQASRLELERRRALVEVERSKATPDLSLAVGAKRDNDLGLTQAVVGLTVPLPLFDRNQGNVLEASQRALKAEEELRGKQLALRHELRNASAQLEAAQSAAQQIKATVLPAAQEAHEAATRGFEAGKFSQLEVLDAQRSLLAARERLLDSQASAYQAASTIDRILGE